MSDSGEFALIRWIRDRTERGPSTVLGIGDDCAIVRPTPSEDLLVSTDMLMDGRHFRLDECGAEAAGYKAMAVNISDIAAMAGRPLAAVVAVALPKRSAVEVARRLHAGLTNAAERFGVPIVGGDTNAWDGPLVITVTILGETTGRGPVPRSGAKVGDMIFVTGPLGGSLLGRHLKPEPRVLEALALHAEAPIQAMIDLSDGLASDLRHVLDESGGLGALLDESAIPIHPDAVALSEQDGRSPLDHALADGEDFELCLTLAPEHADRLVRLSPPPARLFRIGTVVESPGIRLRGCDGVLRDLPKAGFDHLYS